MSVARCRNGHLKTPENTYERNGYRYCRQCRAANLQKRQSNPKFKKVDTLAKQVRAKAALAVALRHSAEFHEEINRHRAAVGLPPLNTVGVGRPTTLKVSA